MVSPQSTSKGDKHALWRRLQNWHVCMDSSEKPNKMMDPLEEKGDIWPRELVEEMEYG